MNTIIEALDSFTTIWNTPALILLAVLVLAWVVAGIKVR